MSPMTLWRVGIWKLTFEKFVFGPTSDSQVDADSAWRRLMRNREISTGCILHVKCISSCETYVTSEDVRLGQCDGYEEILGSSLDKKRINDTG